jgi:hypothetical protein
MDSHQAGLPAMDHDPFMDQNSASTAGEFAERLTRPEAIARIRATLSALTDDENCACSVAARYGVLCKGFTKLPDRAFRDRFSWIAKPRPLASRAELEQIVTAYHRGRLEARGSGGICCDVETREHCACDGWNQFDDAALERFCLEITGRRVSIG